MQPRELKVGEIVQLDPDVVGNKYFAATLMVVTELKPWGAQGFVQALGSIDGGGGQAYYRARWEEMEPTGGFAVWVPGSENEE